MWRGIAYAVAAAFFFGLSAPLSKELLDDGLDALLLAGLLYLGAGLGPGARLLLNRVRGQANPETPVRRADWKWLLPSTFCGGVAAPALLTAGIVRASASQSSLLLSLESAFTAALAWTVFREPCGRRVFIGMLFIVAGSAVLSLRPGRFHFEVSWSCLLIAGACLCWALDNNLVRKIADSDPVAITMYKGLLAGPVNIAAALLLGAPLPRPLIVIAALVLGAISYGLCYEYMIQSMRRIGAARMGAYFNTAPFFGALFSIALLGERPAASFWWAAALMACGLWLYATEGLSTEKSGP